MTFNISQWSEGDNPQLIIDFINEVMDDLRPSYSQSGWYTLEQQQEILKKYARNNNDYSFTYYDGKILNVSYKGVEIAFAKSHMSYEFTFDNLFVALYEDWSYYGRDTVFNSSYKENRYNSIYQGFENLLDIKGITDKPITVVVTKENDM